MPYPVLAIEPEWVLEPEQLGTKDKYWVRFPTDHNPSGGGHWLFKYPTENTGQHWAEKIAYEVACAMKVLAPRVELAELDGVRGSATESFTHAQSYELFHGNQILAGIDAEYPPDQRFQQNRHTINRIFGALDILFAKATRFKDQIASYLVLDALISNVDRHHENWGILRKRTDDGWRGRLAPSYDHASSLGRELQDEGGKQNRQRYLTELGIEKYLERGRGPVFMDGTGKHGPSPQRLIARCLEIPKFAPHFRPALKKLRHLTPQRLTTIIAGVPDDWMSPLAREFAFALLTHTLEYLGTLNE